MIDLDDWPETVVVETRDLLAVMWFVDLISAHGVPDYIPESSQHTIDAAARAWNKISPILDEKCPGWD